MDNPYETPIPTPSMRRPFPWKRLLIILAIGVLAVPCIAVPLRVVVRWAGEPAFKSVESQINNQWIEDYNRRVDEASRAPD